MKNLKTMLSSEDMTWATPQAFFDEHANSAPFPSAIVIFKAPKESK